MASLIHYCCVTVPVTNGHPPPVPDVTLFPRICFVSDCLAYLSPVVWSSACWSRLDLLKGEGDTGWTYSWYKDGNTIYPYITSNTYTFNFVVQYDSGTYTCRGYRGRDSQSSEISNAVTLTVSERPQALLSVSPQSWLTEGVSVSLSCEVRDSSTGWTFSWYRAVPYRECLSPVTDIHGYVRYCVELLSESSRRAGGSYTLSPAALHHTGVYVCRAERGEPAYQTQYSNTQPLWITGEDIQQLCMCVCVCVCVCV
ncbi:uncharacterized protein LOC118240635, partial [Electrophorus electricus]|uniref:uncharacterized protein LOC118240635 n=1 Tax=Electrophorus electricus TaxID=8005 RepID=UPI0015D0CC3E